MNVGTHLELENPEDSSRSKNPDIMFTMSDGRRWAIACKAVRGDSEVTLYERFEEGVNQIDRSSADVGFVFLTFKDRIPHDDHFAELGEDDAGFPILGAQRDHTVVVEALRKWGRSRIDAMARHATPPQLVKLLGASKSLPGLMFITPTVIGVPTRHGPTPTIANALTFQTFNVTGLRELNPADCAAIQQIHRGFFHRFWQ